MTVPDFLQTSQPQSHLPIMFDPENGLRKPEESAYKPVDHDFSHHQLHHDAKPNVQPYVKLTFYFKKRPDISYEAFHKHWQTVHADLAVGSKAFAAYNTRYIQYHLYPEDKKKAASFEGFEMLDFDGSSEIHVKSFEDAKKFFESEEYVASMREDEGNWLARPVYMMVGYDNLIYGKAMEGGTDGIMPRDLKH